MPLQGLLEGICSTYMKGPYTSPRPLRRSLFYLYQNHIPLQPLQGLVEGVCSTYMKGPYTSPRPRRRSLFYLYEGPVYLSEASWQKPPEDKNLLGFAGLAGGLRGLQGVSRETPGASRGAPQKLQGCPLRRGGRGGNLEPLSEQQKNAGEFIKGGHKTKIFLKAS